MGQLTATTQEVDDRLAKVVDVAHIATPAVNTNLSTTWVKMNGLWNDSQREGFIIDGGDLVYDYDEDLDMVFWGAGSVEAASTNTTVSVGIAVNGVIVTGSNASTICRVADELYPVALVSGKKQMTKGDTLSVYIKIASGTVDVTGTEYRFAALKSY